MITVILSNQLWNIIIWSKIMATDVFTLNRIVFMPNHFLHINWCFGEGRQCIGKAFEGLLVLCTLQLQAYKENKCLIKHARNSHQIVNVMTATEKAALPLMMMWGLSIVSNVSLSGGGNTLEL